MEQRDLENQMSLSVVKSNDLVRKARYSLTAVEQKFICYLIAKVKPEDDDLQTYEISVEEFCAIIGVDKNHFYGEFKELLDGFDTHNFWIETGRSSIKWYWFDYVEYVHGEGRVRVALTRQLSKYLLHLSQNFTAYELYNILGLRSKYAIRLFEFFKSYEYRQIIKIDVDNLKELLCIDGYPNFFDFRKYVLTPALREICQYTELDVEEEEIRKGHRIATVVFRIAGKPPVERLECFNRVEHLLDGVPLDQLSLFDRRAQE